jgi:Fe-S-cluster containining protein
MEIKIDAAYVRDILSREREATTQDLAAGGPLAALEHSQRRHETCLASAPDIGTLACRAGCHWCCYFSVDVRAVEVFRIVAFIDETFDAGRRSRVEAAVRSNAALLSGLDEMQRMTRNVRCPFLEDDGRCGIYAVRPQTCRNYHATDVTGCQLSYEQPEEVDIDPDFAPYTFQAGVAHVEGFASALAAHGLDTRVYELNGAFAAAFADRGARARFEAGGLPFLDLEGDEVQGEFDDLGS